jgi:lipopolysaccharide transport system permease protein
MRSRIACYACSASDSSVSTVDPTEFRWRPFIYLRDLVFTLVARDIKLRYKGSYLGVAWTLLNPLTHLVVLYFIFNSVLPLDIPNYASFLFIGILVWSWFQSAVLLSTNAIVENRALIRQPGFPVAILPAITVTSHLIHFLIALPILFLFLGIDGGRFTSALWALLPVIAIQYVFTLSLAYLVSILHVEFRDTQYLLSVLMQLLFFLTPVFYGANAIPERYQPLYQLNPMVHLIDAYREILMEGRLPPNVSPLLIVTMAAVGCLLFGHMIFLRTSYRFVDEL